MNERTPFDMIKGRIKGQDILLRPVRFDSDDYDKQFIKPDGSAIRPEMGVSTCPICFQLIEQEFPKSLDLNEVIDVYCNNCTPVGAVKFVFPFVDPFETKELKIADINPQAFKGTILYQEPTSPEIVVIESTDLEERKLGGIGQFVRKRDQWKKDVVDEFDYLNKTNSDSHDVMGMIAGEAGSDQNELIDLSESQ